MLDWNIDVQNKIDLSYDESSQQSDNMKQAEL